MSVRSLLALAAPATFWMLFGAEPAQAQGGPFAEIRCNRLGSDPKMSSSRPEPLRELRAQAEADGCDAVVRRIDAQLARMAGGQEEPAARPPQPDCTMARTLADIALSSNDRGQIRTARESVRGCASESRRLNEWLEAHPEEEGGAPLRALAPWEDYSEARLDSQIGETRYDEFRVRLQQNEGVAIKMRSGAFVPLLAIGTGRMPDNFNQMNYAIGAGGEDGQSEVVLHFQATMEGVNDYVVVAAHDGAAGASGPYTITRESWTPPPPPPPMPVTAGVIASGEITPETAQRSGSSRLVYDTWSYQGRAGERLRISLRSQDFDPYLIFGRMRDGAFEQIATDDDGGDGLDSLLRMQVLPDDDVYLIRTRSLGGNPGRYALLVESLPPRSTERVSFGDANAWSAEGLLLEDSPHDENGHWHQDYTIRAPRSGAVVARVLSTEFSPVVDVSEVTREGVRPIDVYTEESVRPRSEVTFTAERRRTYLIRVRTDANYGGEFDLVVEQPED